jgi:hypothetical protein
MQTENRENNISGNNPRFVSAIPSSVSPFAPATKSEGYALSQSFDYE